MSAISTNSVGPPAPEGLTTRAVAMWDRITQEFELREDGLITLHEACKALTRVEQMEKVMRDDVIDLVVLGSQRQPVAHPLLAEIRQTSQLLVQHLARLKLDGIEDDPDTGFSFMYSPASQRGSSGARARFKERV